MSLVVHVVVLAAVSALLGAVLYGIPMARMAIGPRTHMARHPFLAALWGFGVGAVVWFAWTAVFGGLDVEAGEIATDLAGVPVMIAVGNYTAGRLARRRAANSPDPSRSGGEAS